MTAMLISTKEAGHWVAAQFDTTYAPDLMTVVGLERDGKMVAGILYENFNGRSMVAHIAITGRPTREFFRFNAEYAFHHVKVQKLIAPVASDNMKSIRLVKKIGFVEEARIANADPHGDILLFTLTEANCRFLRERYGKTQIAAIA